MLDNVRLDYFEEDRESYVDEKNCLLEKEFVGIYGSTMFG